ncbi:MAG: ParB N-terminal domain-containing protein [Limnochordia bacterium]|jgi:small-conductance mechanosensitive channel
MYSTAGNKHSRVALGVWLGIMIIAFVAATLAPDFLKLPSGIATFTVLGLIAGVVAGSELFSLITDWLLVRRKKPASESAMISRLYRLAAFLAVVMIVAYGFGALASFTSFFTLFGGMLLGWSLQAPVSGFAAFLLVLLKRPFRPGDRIQFPNLGLTGDVHEVGPMYTVLNQVGGSIGSEEAVGRYILVPNAMLFSQVLINYTVTQEAAFILDEVTIRITYDSDWGLAERLLLAAANDVTPDIIAATGVKPYIRSDLYDYGVYLRLRYMTRVKDRPAIAYEITKRVFDSFQHETSVDFAIPYVYSYRAGAGRKDDELLHDAESRHVRQIEVRLIEPTYQPRVDEHDIEMLMDSIAERGLLQPIVVVKDPHSDLYDIVAGHMRFEAVKRLGWKTIPAVVRGEHTQTA